MEPEKTRYTETLTALQRRREQGSKNCCMEADRRRRYGVRELPAGLGAFMIPGDTAICPGIRGMKEQVPSGIMRKAMLYPQQGRNHQAIQAVPEDRKERGKGNMPGLCPGRPVFSDRRPADLWHFTGPEHAGESRSAWRTFPV